MCRSIAWNITFTVTLQVFYCGFTTTYQFVPLHTRALSLRSDWKLICVSNVFFFLCICKIVQHMKIKNYIGHEAENVRSVSAYVNRLFMNIQLAQQFGVYSIYGPLVDYTKYTHAYQWKRCLPSVYEILYSKVQSTRARTITFEQWVLAFLWLDWWNFIHLTIQNWLNNRIKKKTCRLTCDTLSCLP